jgi:hypothetical protein
MHPPTLLSMTFIRFRCTHNPQFVVGVCRYYLRCAIYRIKSLWFMALTSPVVQLLGSKYSFYLHFIPWPAHQLVPNSFLWNVRCTKRTIPRQVTKWRYLMLKLIFIRWWWTDNVMRTSRNRLIAVDLWIYENTFDIPWLDGVNDCGDCGGCDVSWWALRSNFAQYTANRLDCNIGLKQ